MRLQLAVISGKFLRFLSKGLRLGEGSNLPGKVAKILDPSILASLACSRDTILITGTNGKTTTTHLIARIFEENKMTFVHNSYGANLKTGIITSLISQANLSGKIDGDYNLFEVDEATLPLIIQDLKPKVIILTNIFRDQLDRYGDLDGLLSKLSQVLTSLTETTLVVNGDDPLLYSLTGDLNLPVIYYGLEEDRDLGKTFQAVDMKNCPRCGSPYQYQVRYYAHLGRYSCQSCGNRRPELDVYASSIHLSQKESTFTLHYQGQEMTSKFGLPGYYNIYNLLAALATSLQLGFSMDTSISSLKSFKPVFGRLEDFYYQGREIRVILVKNPTGFNEVLGIIKGDTRKKGILFFLNDNTADGEDISWIWDVDFQGLNGEISCFVSGLRGEEMALRLKYSDIQSTIFPYQREDFLAVLRDAQGEILYILPTYTALLRILPFLKDLQKRRGDCVS